MSEYTEAQVQAAAQAMGKMHAAAWREQSSNSWVGLARAALEAAAQVERRAPVQGHGISAAYAEASGGDYKPPGTIAWEEHVLAWEDYHRKHPNHQTAEIIAQRHGFSYRELIDHLGHEPKTWRPNK